jgi:hypothetical protein
MSKIYARENLNFEYVIALHSDIKCSCLLLNDVLHIIINVQLMVWYKLEKIILGNFMLHRLPNFKSWLVYSMFR